jgi:uncharacterized protein YjgD (DUF1641 family)
MSLNIPCIFTGKYDTIDKLPTTVVRGGKGSFFSVAEFNPGTPLQNAVQARINRIDETIKENEETIQSVVELSNHPNTPINIQGINHRFSKQFYDGIIADMLDIQSALASQKEVNTSRMTLKQLKDSVEEIVTNYLIIPIFKKRGNNLVMLMGDCYTLNKNKTKTHFGNSTETFYQIAKRMIQPTVVQRVRGGGLADMNLFPESDHSPKLFEYNEEIVNDTEYQNSNVDNANVFGKSDANITIDLQKELDDSFDRSFDAVMRNTVFANENVYETLYTYYIYENQRDGMASTDITEEDIIGLIDSSGIRKEDIEQKAPNQATRNVNHQYMVPPTPAPSRKRPLNNSSNNEQSFIPFNIQKKLFKNKNSMRVTKKQRTMPTLPAISESYNVYGGKRNSKRKIVKRSTRRLRR